MKIEIYGKPNCPYCTSAKTLLQAKNVNYDYIEFFDLTDGDQTVVRERAPTARTFPMIFIDDTYIGGFTNLESAFN